MNFDLEGLPLWGERLFWTGVTLAVAYTIGHVINGLLVNRLARIVQRTAGRFDDDVLVELKSRVPWWSLLVGAWLSVGYWALQPQAHVLATRAIFVLGAASVTFFVAAVVSRAIASYGASVTPTVPVTSLTQNMAWILVVILGGLIILNGLGISITPLLTALGVGGLAVALALQEPLGNLFAGLFVTLAGQVRVGDYVKLDSGEEGFVVDFSWRSTRIRMLANNLIIVPNSKLSQAIITNYHLPSQDLAVLINVGVDYASDLAHVEQVTIETAKQVMAEVTGGVREFEPFIRYNEFGDSSINFTVIMRGQQFTDQFLVKHEFVKRLHRRYEQEGIAIPWPIRTLVAREPFPLLSAASGEDSGARPPAPVNR